MFVLFELVALVLMVILLHWLWYILWFYNSSLYL